MFKHISLISVLVLVTVAGCKHDRPPVSPASADADIVMDCQVAYGLAYVTVYGKSVTMGFPTDHGLYGQSRIDDKDGTTLCLVGDANGWYPAKDMGGIYCTKMNAQKRFEFTVRPDDISRSFSFGDFRDPPVRWMMTDRVEITGDCHYNTYHPAFVRNQK